MNCPYCGKFSNCEIICDNDCGTITCEYCEKEFYTLVTGSLLYIIKGHKPQCGEDE